MRFDRTSSTKKARSHSSRKLAIIPRLHLGECTTQQVISQAAKRRLWRRFSVDEPAVWTSGGTIHGGEAYDLLERPQKSWSWHQGTVDRCRHQPVPAGILNPGVIVR
jgi:hypothetical protein